MDQEIAEAQGGWSASAVLGLVEFRVEGRKQVGRHYVNRTLVIRKNFKVSSPMGPCELILEDLPVTMAAPMVHINPIDMYRDVERSISNVESAPDIESLPEDTWEQL